MQFTSVADLLPSVKTAADVDVVHLEARVDIVNIFTAEC